MKTKTILIILIIIAIITGLILLYNTTYKTYTFTPYNWSDFKTCSANPSDSELDPSIQEMLEQTTPAEKKKEVDTIQKATDNPEDNILDDMRQQMNENFKSANLEPVANVEDKKIPGPHGDIPIRIYSPESTEKLPVIVFFHGGGWTAASIDTHDSITRTLANRTPAVVVSVDYRLAPEYPYPIPLDESYQALEWVSENIKNLNGDPEKIAVAGDSAGGNLAAAVALKARDENGPDIFYQILYYPATDLTETNDFSFSRFSNGYDLTQGMVQASIDSYTRGTEKKSDPYLSPLLADDLSNLPPALIIAAQFDPIVDQGLAYAGKLNLADVPTKYTCYNGVIHGFVSMLPDNKSAIQAINETTKIFR